jgi:hypothetical protein
MKKHNKLYLACLLMAGVMMISGCGTQNTGNQSQDAGKETPVGKVTEKKESDYLLTGAKFYDADGTCTMDILYEYNAEGKVVHKVQQNFGQNEMKFEFFYTYPDAITRLETCIDKDTGVRSQVDTTVYDQKGNIKTETSTVYDREGYSNVMSQTEYTYDKQVNLILKEKHSTATVGSALNNITKTEYTYDDTGNCLTEKQINSREGQEDQVWSDLEYQYDSKGNRTREISHIANEHIYSPIVYEYNHKGQKAKETDYASTSPDTVKRYYVFEYDKNGNEKKYNCYSADDQLLSYAEYEYVKISDLKTQEKLASDKDRLYKTWNVDGTVSSTISFQFIDPANGVRCEIKNFDIRAQQESTGGTTTTVELTDKTININSAPDVYTTLTFWFEADGTLKLKDTATGNTISLHAQ